MIKEFAARVLSLLFNDSGIVYNQVERLSNVVASKPSDYGKNETKVKITHVGRQTFKEVIEGTTPMQEIITEIDWTRMHDRALQDMFGSIEISNLLMNPSFIGTIADKHAPSLQESGKGLEYVMKKAASEQAKRELFMDKVFLESDIDAYLLDAFKRVPVDKPTRLKLLSLNVDQVQDYVVLSPDPMIDGKFDKDIADQMVNTLLFNEKFYGDPNNRFELANYEIQKKAVERTAKVMIEQYADRFPKGSIDGLVNITHIPTVLSRLACIKVMKETKIRLAKSDNNNVLKSIVECTKDCDILNEVIKNKNANDNVLDAARLKRGNANCK